MGSQRFLSLSSSWFFHSDVIVFIWPNGIPIRFTFYAYVSMNYASSPLIAL